MADPEQLKQVFVNLISNAVQAMAETGGTLTIETGADERLRRSFAFTDTGPGIPAGRARQGLRPVLLHPGAKAPGSGLTIVHRIVDDHDGHIEVASEPGVGTAFTVWLPALQ